MAPLIFFCRAMAFSLKSANRERMVSRIPPNSPASIMLAYSPSKTLGCLRIESARVVPVSTSFWTVVITCLKVGLACCLPRICRHCTSGRPASIMVDICRVKMTRSLPVTLGLKNLIFSSRSFGFTLMVGLSMRMRLSCARAPASSMASTSPLRFSPKLFFPFQT